MNYIYRPASAVLLLLLLACQGGQSESQRGKTQTIPSIDNPDDLDNDSDDAIGSADPNQAPVIVDKGDVQALKLLAEADQSALPAGFIDDIFAIHKITPGKTLLFGKNKQSWLLDEAKEGALTRLTVDISAPADTTLYILENKNFWLIGKNSVAFPSTVPSTDPTQLTLINLAPDLMKNPAAGTRILFAAPQRLIIASDKRANIVVLDGDKARVIALDFPRMGDQSLPVVSAGLIQGSDSFWFLSSERLMLLKKNAEGKWRWIVAKFKLDAEGIATDAVTQVAMLLDAKDDKSFSYLGRTFEIAGKKIYEQNPIKLSVDNRPDPTLDPIFVNSVQPLLKTYCTPCHVGYEDYAVTKAKAAAYKQMIADGSMPKNLALTAEQIKILTDYMTLLLTP